MTTKLFNSVYIPLLVFILISCNSTDSPLNLLNNGVQKKLEDDSRNSSVSINVRYKSMFNSDTLYFDLKEVGPGNSRADVFRVLLQTAQAIKNEKFKTVILCWQGEEKFLLFGIYFRQLGLEYGIQNPAYTMRTFPEHVRDLHGSRVFSDWSGGYLGVMARQIQDFNEFHNRWYGIE